MSKVIIPEGIDMHTLASNFSILDVGDLEIFMKEIDALITRKKSKPKKYRIAELNQLINTSVLSPEELIEYKTLIQKLENKTITETERQHFLVLVQEDEALRGERMKYMYELSQLRQVSFQAITDEFSLIPQS